VKALVAANAFAALPLYIWCSLFSFEAKGYPSLTSWDIWVYFPLVMALGLLAAMGAFTFAKRKPAAIAVSAIAALVVSLPFTAMIGG
jgi:hypothetical protein